MDREEVLWLLVTNADLGLVPIHDISSIGSVW